MNGSLRSSPGAGKWGDDFFLSKSRFFLHACVMANVIVRPDWHLSDRCVTDENVFLNRRRFLRQVGLGGAGLAGVLSSGRSWSAESAAEAKAAAAYPAKRNPQFDPGWRITHETVAGSYNNFYEFSLDKHVTPQLTARFITQPWPIEIKGLIEKPMVIDAGEFASLFGLEERVYRLRCVEAWAMIVPWTGFQLSKLIDKVVPKAEAKFIRFETFNRPDQAPNFRRVPHYPWPYFEGLRLDEARHPLTLVGTGIYGKPLPKQHGAPVRIIVPWKYGYKSIKSVVKIEFIQKQPTTFWETIAADEYPFESNVNPKVPHPRWSQATERVLDSNDRIKT